MNISKSKTINTKTKKKTTLKKKLQPPISVSNKFTAQPVCALTAANVLDFHRDVTQYFSYPMGMAAPQTEQPYVKFGNHEQWYFLTNF